MRAVLGAIAGMIAISTAMISGAETLGDWDAVPLERPAYWERKTGDGMCVVLQTSGQYVGLVIRNNSIASKWEWMSGAPPHQLTGARQDKFCVDAALPWDRR